MTILNRIRDDSLRARKARDQTISALLGTLLGEITTKEKTFSPVRSVTDQEVLAIVQSFVKKNNETAAVLEKNPDRAADLLKIKQEAMALMSYMPQQMSEDDLEVFARDKLASGLSMGGIMAALKSERSGQYDGKIASQIVKRITA